MTLHLDLHRNAYTELQPQHYELMHDIRNGADIYGFRDAKLIRQIETIDKELVDIVDIDTLQRIHNKTFDGTKQLPYFGAILTPKGRKLVRDYRKANKIKGARK